VKNMGSMFYNASSFSQTLCWDVSGKVTTDWLVGTNGASNGDTCTPTATPSIMPTISPTGSPVSTVMPTFIPTVTPTAVPTITPTIKLLTGTIVESNHPYDPKTQNKWKISLAKYFNRCAVLTMDPLSSTPSKKDAFVKIEVKDGDTKTKVGGSKLYGDGLSEFPSTVVTGDVLKVIFKSTSNSEPDYGFKLYIAPCPP